MGIEKILKSRIFVIEDEVPIAEDICQKLEAFGYEVVGVAYSGEEALQTVKEASPDVVLMDINLAGKMNGLQAASNIQSVCDVPIIYLTSSAEQAAILETHANEPPAYISKPIKDRELHTILDTALYRHAQEQKLRKSQAQLSAIVDALPDLGFIYDKSGRYVEILAREDDLLYQDAASMKGHLLHEILPKPVADLLLSAIQKTIVSRENQSVEYSLDVPAGQRWFEGRMAPLPTVPGEIEQIILIARDITQRKLADLALRESEERFRNTFEQAAVGLGHTSLDGDFLRVNQRFCQITGYSETEMHALNFKDITHPHDVEEDILQISRLLSGESPGYSRQKRYIRKDGSLIWINLTVSLVRGETGEPKYLIGVIEDISTRKLAEQALQQRAAQLALLNDIGEKIASVLNLESVIDRAVHLVQESFAYHHVALFVVDPYLQKAFMRARSGIFANLFPQEHVLALGQGMVGWVAKNGKTLLANDVNAEPQYVNNYPDVINTCSELSVPIRVSDEVIGVLDAQSPELGAFSQNDILVLETLADQIAVAMDNARLHASVQTELAERIRAEAERESLLNQIREQSQQVREIMNSVPEGVILLDSTGQILLTNPVASSDLAEFAGLQVGDKLEKVGDRPLSELLTSPPAGLWHEVKFHGRTFNVIARPTASGPEPERWVMVMRDVTREREMQQSVQLQERLAAIGQISAGIAHDFNNILAVILLYTEIMLGASDLLPGQAERLHTIAQQSRNASHLIQQILDFSRRSVLELMPLDLLPFLKEQTRLLERTLPENIRIHLSYLPGEYWTNADPTRLQQAIMNLAINARDAMLDGGELFITISKSPAGQTIHCTVCGELLQENCVCIEIRDTGCGISAENLPHIFEPFFTTKPPGEGTGLGLSQVYGIIRQHDGHIDVTSQVDEGATFCIYLPARAIEDKETSSIETPDLIHGDGQNILLVEDDPVTRQALTDGLTLLGYRVLAVTNGRDALNLLDAKTNHIDLILSDVVMPNMGGVALFYAIRARQLTIPMILMSGHPTQESPETLQLEGLKAWLLKPPSLKQLSKTIARALEQPHM
jgi:two-component system cell cycle sensor histidine kinase/response regulator CckA